MNKKILGMGNALLDVLIPIENEKILEQFCLPKGASTIVDHENYLKILEEVAPLIAKKETGGSAANTIHGIASLGTKTGFIGKTGNDYYGKFLQDEMDSNGIIPYFSHGTYATGMAITLVTPDSERTFAVYLGAALELTADDLLPNIFYEYDIFHIEGYLIQNYELIHRALHYAKKANMLISLDLATYTMVKQHHDFLKKMIEEYVDILFANEEEAIAFTGKQPQEALSELSNKCTISIVKIGKEGSLIQAGERVFHQQAISVTPLDTTGAGDLYASGFLYGIASGLDLTVCSEIGTLLATQVIQTLGAKIEDTYWNNLNNEIKTKAKIS